MKVFTRHKNDKLSRKEIKNAVKWYMRKLVPDTYNITVTVISKPLTLNGMCTSPSIGATKDDINFVEALTEVKTSSHYIIHLNPEFDRMRQISTIAHECVHIKQFCTGQLHLEEFKFRWNKKWHYYQDFDYYDLPYEIDAYGYEYGLYARYKDVMLNGTLPS